MRVERIAAWRGKDRGATPIKLAVCLTPLAVKKISFIGVKRQTNVIWMEKIAVWQRTGSGA